MPNRTFLAATLAFSLLLPCALLAQHETALQTGQIPFQSYDVNDIDSINLQNGNLSIRVPLLNYPQVGGILKVAFGLSYESKQDYAARVCPPGGTCDYVWGANGNNINCCSLHGSVDTSPVGVSFGGMYSITSFSYQTSSTTTKTVYSACSDGGCHELANTDGTWRSIDATGLSANITNGEVIDKSGVKYFRVAYPNIGIIASDPYGNSLSGTLGTVVTDTMGRTFPSITTSSDTTGCATTGRKPKNSNFAPNHGRHNRSQLLHDPVGEILVYFSCRGENLQRHFVLIG